MGEFFSAVLGFQKFQNILGQGFGLIFMDPMIGTFVSLDDTSRRGFHMLDKGGSVKVEILVGPVGVHDVSDLAGILKVVGIHRREQELEHLKVGVIAIRTNGLVGKIATNHRTHHRRTPGIPAHVGGEPVELGARPQPAQKSTRDKARRQKDLVAKDDKDSADTKIKKGKGADVFQNEFGKEFGVFAGENHGGDSSPIVTLHIDFIATFLAVHANHFGQGVADFGPRVPPRVGEGIVHAGIGHFHHVIVLFKVTTVVVPGRGHIGPAREKENHRRLVLTVRVELAAAALSEC